MYNFPKRWHLNIETIDDLAKSLEVSVETLESFKGVIRSHYIQKEKEKDGKFRTISIPSNSLKKIQHLILRKILRFNFPKYVQGGVSGRSIIKNAKIHRQQKWVAILDIRKFFPSIHYSRIINIFSDIGCSEAVTKTITNFVSYRYELPQGAPTSPIIANLVLYNLDQRISRLCRIKGLNYSRYFDDITISGNRKLEHVCDKITEISSKESFPIHLEGSKRFKIIPSSKPQIVTGFVVNGKKLKVHKEFLSKLENNIEDLENERLIDVPLYEFLDKIKGMIAFLQSVQPIKAQFLSNKLKQIDPDKYRLDSS